MGKNVKRNEKYKNGINDIQKNSRAIAENTRYTNEKLDAMRKRQWNQKRD